MKTLALLLISFAFLTAHAAYLPDHQVDKCPNLEGFQKYIPDDRHLVDGQCVLNVPVIPPVEPPATTTPPVEPPAPTDSPTVENHSSGGHSSIQDPVAYARFMHQAIPLPDTKAEQIDILQKLIALYQQWLAIQLTSHTADVKG